MAADVNEKENARKMRICLTSLQPWLCAGFHGDVTKLVPKNISFARWVGFSV
jgi:hypothetical protein